MVLDRCPHCAAAVPSDGQWCGQCFADLRPAPEPVVAREPAAFDPLTAPLPSVQAALAPTAASYAAIPPPPTSPPPGEPPPPASALAPLTWPCVKCGHRNPADDDNCARCGAGFLAGVEDSDLVLPMVGRARDLQRSHKVGIVLGGGVALMVLILLLMLVLGSVV